MSIHLIQGLNMKQSELNQILKEHEEWLKDNKKGKRADLNCADFRNANLNGVNLRDRKSVV